MNDMEKVTINPDIIALQETITKGNRIAEKELIIEDSAVAAEELKATTENLLKEPATNLLAGDVQKRLDALEKTGSLTLQQSIASSIIHFIMPFLKDLFLISEYAKIEGEKDRLQPLRTKVRPQLMDIERGIEAVRRDKGYTNDFLVTLTKYGYTDNDIKHIMDMINYIPSVQDVISFAVREVYDDTFARRWNLDEGLTRIEANARPEAERAGIKWTDFQKYWRAHWQLPSPNQLYEMLHRGKISLEDVKRALEANDFMPGFIQPFIDISFNPLTRVDVRRMHKLGILSNEQVKKSYMDLGYDEQNADGLTKFTIELNKEKAPKDRELDKELTKADILSAYDYQLFTRAEAREGLKSLGYNNEEADYYLDRQDYKQYQDRAKILIDTYHKAYLNGIYDRSKTVALLGQLDLPARYTDTLLGLWDIERDARTETPTKSELLGFYKTHVITQEVCRQELKSLGYQDKYIDWYIKSVHVNPEIKKEV